MSRNRRLKTLGLQRGTDLGIAGRNRTVFTSAPTTPAKMLSSRPKHQPLLKITLKDGRYE